jgi:hypothetical protein
MGDKVSIRAELANGFSPKRFSKNGEPFSVPEQWLCFERQWVGLRQS